ncbi:MAG: hypothetical protein LLF28_01135 [Nitrospiraceae bacterium]|nr:hypothetical protein [Nitrospiraceae bacterium]
MDKELTIEACTLCAWRETCQKKFSISGKDLRCPDFARDISIKGRKTDIDESRVKQKDDLR